MIKGYKVFNSDWTCRNKQYTCPGEFEEDVTPVECESGMHFCEDPADCFRYYQFNPENHVCEIEAYGDIDRGANKVCTNKLRVIREIPWDEVLRLVNTGKDCTGLRNTGDRNTGKWNTGDRNTGDWNAASFSSGCFCTGDQKILMFDKPSEWTLRDWWDSDARRLMNNIQKNVVEWVYTENMSEEEKEKHPEHKTTGGYLKILDESECAQIWWDGLDQTDRQIIMDLPNFNAEIFRKCTGIKI